MAGQEVTEPVPYDWSRRHPSVAHFEKLFAYQHLPPSLQAISQPFYELAIDMLTEMDDSPEMAAGLRKLVEAKDCMVRNMVLTK